MISNGICFGLVHIKLLLCILATPYEAVTPQFSGPFNFLGRVYILIMLSSVFQSTRMIVWVKPIQSYPSMSPAGICIRPLG